MRKGMSFKILVITVAFVVMLMLAIFFLTIGKDIADKIIDQLFGSIFPRPPS